MESEHSANERTHRITCSIYFLKNYRLKPQITLQVSNLPLQLKPSKKRGSRPGVKKETWTRQKKRRRVKMRDDKEGMVGDEECGEDNVFLLILIFIYNGHN